jgi:hypothetical protein
MAVGVESVDNSNLWFQWYRRDDSVRLDSIYQVDSLGGDRV